MLKAGYKILHLTPHFGGGVGSVVLNWLAQDEVNANVAASWDFANDKAVTVLNSLDLPLHADMNKRPAELLSLMAEADIVLAHFWNHPLAYNFFVNHPLPPTRLVFWCHAAGLHPPYIFPPKLLAYADHLVFTSPVSLAAEEVKSFPKPEQFSVIVSTSGVERLANLTPRPHSGFNIGYIGTVDYAKLHPAFPAMCAQIARAIPEVKFYVLSGDSQQRLKRDIENLGLADRFAFIGQVADVSPYLEIFDLFGYPLNPDHFGTAEQALQEAMAASLAPVVLNNPAEINITREFGVIAENPADYVAKVVALHQDRATLAALGTKARQFALATYPSANLRQSWQKLFEATMARPKRARHWPAGARPLSAYGVFLESLGKYAALFAAQEPERSENLRRLASVPAWRSASKGTPFQYAAFFPDDPDLAEICRIMQAEI